MAACVPQTIHAPSTAIKSVAFQKRGCHPGAATTANSTPPTKSSRPAKNRILPASANRSSSVCGYDEAITCPACASAEGSAPAPVVGSLGVVPVGVAGAAAWPAAPWTTNVVEPVSGWPSPPSARHCTPHLPGADAAGTVMVIRGPDAFHASLIGSPVGGNSVASFTVSSMSAVNSMITSDGWSLRDAPSAGVTDFRSACADAAPTSTSMAACTTTIADANRHGRYQGAIRKEVIRVRSITTRVAQGRPTGVDHMLS